MKMAWYRTAVGGCVVPGLQLGQLNCSEFLAFYPFSLLVLSIWPPNCVAFPWSHGTDHSLESGSAGPMRKDWEIEAEARPGRGKKGEVTRA